MKDLVYNEKMAMCEGFLQKVQEELMPIKKEEVRCFRVRLYLNRGMRKCIHVNARNFAQLLN